jgi:hypothetical protein
MDDIKCWFSQPNVGTIETALSPFWRLIPHYAPNAKIITIRRPVDEVVESLIKLGFAKNTNLIKGMYAYDRKLDQLEKRLPHVRRINFNDLNDIVICGDLFEYCTETPRDDERCKFLQQFNLQIDFSALMRYYLAYQEPLNKLAKIAKSISISEMHPKEDVDDGIIIREETLSNLLRDGKTLFAEHAIDVGESTDSYLTKNIPLMQKLEDVGCLQIHIARCNGRIFGYLMSIISPSLERQNTKTGVHTLFYTSKDVKNLGLRLQRASVEGLKAKGCDEIIFRAGIRGSTAERISTLYKRLGASPFGELYRLELED